MPEFSVYNLAIRKLIDGQCLYIIYQVAIISACIAVFMFVNGRDLTGSLEIGQFVWASGPPFFVFCITGCYQPHLPVEAIPVS